MNHHLLDTLPTEISEIRKAEIDNFLLTTMNDVPDFLNGAKSVAMADRLRASDQLIKLHDLTTLKVENTITVAKDEYFSSIADLIKSDEPEEPEEPEEPT